MIARDRSQRSAQPESTRNFKRWPNMEWIVDSREGSCISFNEPLLSFREAVKVPGGIQVYLLWSVPLVSSNGDHPAFVPA